MEEKKINRSSLNGNENLIPKECTYKPEYCEQLVKFMSQGYSVASFGAEVKKTKQTLYNWIDKYPEFAEAHAIGKQAALKFFELMLINCAMGIVPEQLKKLGSKKVDVTAVIFALKTRFHREYGEVQKVDHTTSDGSMSPQGMTDEELKAKLKDYGIDQ
jgi:hypothetical protein